MINAKNEVDCFQEAIDHVESIEESTGLVYSDSVLTQELNAAYAACWCFETGSSYCWDF